ncbi:30S ribosomal 3-1, chloroplastic-like [Olea europaea subsp. europaea]|uniref:30S ribosomal 3-1, chloroplastic-like n=1 Tax=Olea europaea subsp. europaea TaxID=158383 RepID=A0A8S0TEM4_OLEEU|nr:30S ribosomal 3-1, chloroplastic-like [Olea europaea subsp. europaea]
MMLSIPVQPTAKSILSFPSFTSQKPCFTPIKTSNSLKPRASSLHSSTHLGLTIRPTSRIQRLNAAAASELAPAETPTEVSDSELAQKSEKLGVEVKSVEKPRLVLKFIWMEKNIGLCLDQMIPGYGTVPLSPYFFWPRKDAWEELKTTLESKPWISQKKMIILLNQATDIINLWQQSGGNLS